MELPLTLLVLYVRLLKIYLSKRPVGSQCRRFKSDQENGELFHDRKLVDYVLRIANRRPSWTTETGNIDYLLRAEYEHGSSLVDY